MSNDNKTLADVQPGGMVRLGDQAERARFEAWVKNHVSSLARAADGEYASNFTHALWSAWQAALSAQPSPATCKEGLQVQPSPGGQGDAHALLAAEYDAAGSDKRATLIREGRDHAPGTSYALRAIEAALAARSPVRIYGCCAQPEGELHTAECPNMQRLSARQPVGQQPPKPAGHAECPVTGLPFYDNMEHPERGLIAMYGGPLDVYSVPVLQDNDGELRRERYDLDADCWVEGGEPLGYFYREQQPDAARQPVGEPVAWMTHHDEPMLFPTAAEAAAYCEDDEQPVPLFRSPAQAVDLRTGIKAIAAERERQLQAEGFTRDGDQQYRRGELARAATAYVQLAAMDLEAGTRNHIAWREPAAVWPWAPEWWKPVDTRRDLVRAGALIAAQIDAIDSQAVGNG